MRYLSVCSGIEAASVAFQPYGWTPVAFSEIDKSASNLLRHRYPETPNWGDMTKFEEWPDAEVDVLCGGTPCQSFSVAGLRQGLADPRGNLMLTFGAIARRYRPDWLVWENVPGVLSSNKGRDFAAFLGLLGELGYGWAYRVLDAQYVRTRRFPHAVPQRRRRVFVVGYFGDWRRAAAVLFDRESLSGHPPPRREAGQGAAPTLAARTRGGGGLRTDFDCDGGLIASTGSVAHCLNAGGMGRLDYETETMVAHALRAEGFDASEDGTGRQTLIPIAFDCKGTEVQHSTGHAPTLRAMGHANTHQNAGGQIAVAFAENQRGEVRTSDVALQLTTGGGKAGQGFPAVAIQERAVSENPEAGPQGAGFNAEGAAYTLEARNKVQAVAYGLSTQQEPKFAEDVSPTLALPSKTGGGQVTAVAFDLRGREGGAMPEGPHDTANIRAASGGSSRSYLAMPWAVRRLTPRECERLQGFPDGYTDVPVGKKRSADGPRYKQLGNSWAVNCADWLAERITEVDGWS